MKSYNISKKIKTCKNNCIFCFIRQLPPGLRDSLYIKDDDYLLSYIYGNFITLTNLNQEDLKRIVKYRLEPLYISVHSLDGNIREHIFGNKRTMRGIENLIFLDKNGIKTNIQIVLCPGINDGKDLENTLLALNNDYKNILSTGIVPVGVTKYNKNNNLISYNKKTAVEIINFVNNIKKYYKSFKKNDNIYLSDEFYIISEIDFPPYNYYKNFYQIENGIGKSTCFLKQVDEYINNRGYTYEKKYKKVLIVTSEYGKVVIKKAIDKLEERYGTLRQDMKLFLKILEVKNKFLGGNIKVTGILSGEDIKINLKKEDIKKYDRVLIPKSIFNQDNLTIDNYKKLDLEKINKNIKIIPEDGYNFIKEIYS